MSEFQIEKGVPVQAKRIGKKPRFPFAEMEVGDSFTVPITARGSVSASALYWTRKTGYMFVCRTTSDKTVRVWRVPSKEEQQR